MVNSTVKRVTRIRDQLERLLSNDFAKLVRTTLSIMQGVDPRVYYTGTDIAYEIVTRTFGNFHAISNDDFLLITQRVNSSLLAQHKSNSEIHRSTVKIASVKVKHLLNNVRAAYGYRIGGEAKPAIDTIAVKLDIFNYVLGKIDELDTSHLTQLNVEIAKLIEKRYADTIRSMKALNKGE